MSLSKEVINRTLSTKHGEKAYSVCELLLDSGHDAWWVGGCVRDMLRGNIPEDIDIATSAHPEDIIKLFPKHDDTAAALGSIIVSVSGHTFEVTTYREDHKLTDGRFPESVQFTDVKSDAIRRDITINAMYWNPISSELRDPFEGEQDLQEGLVRLIGDPQTRITEDALRLLRVIRFRALINGQYHPDTFKALHAKAESVAILSGERRTRELEKILLGPRPELAFKDLWETDVIEHLIPELHACKGVAQPQSAHKEGDVWDHTMQVIAAFTDDHGADSRWAALFHDIGKPVTFSIDNERIKFNEHAKRGGEIASKVFDRLQFPRKRNEKICWIIEHHMMMGTFRALDDSRKAHWYYHPWFIELLQVFWLDIAGTTPSEFDLYETIINDYNTFLDSNPRPKKALLSGEEIMETLSIPPGEEVGRILKELVKEQIEKRVTTKAEAFEFIKRCKTA